VSRARARCWCGRKFDPTRSLDGVSCHEHDADLTGGDQQPEEPRTPARCSCDPWAADEECPVHGENGTLARHVDPLPADVPDWWEVTPDPWSTGPMGPPPF
jgi:hypothetical protein